MKKALYTILGFGVEDKLSAHDKRRIRTVNFINLLMIFFLIIGFTNYVFLKTNFKLLNSLIFIGLAVLSLFLNKFKRTQLAFILFTLNVNLSIFFINKYYPFESGSFLFYFPLIVSIVLLNNPSLRDKYSILHFGICALFFIGNIFIEFPNLIVNNLSEEQIKLLWYYNLIISSSITGILSFLLTRIIYNQNREILLQNSDLQKAQEIVNNSLKEKEVLLAELNHRVKNNLAIISGLLSLQENSIENEEAKRVLSDSKTRIMSMALVHKMLYENPQLKNIAIAKYSSNLLAELLNSYNVTKNIRVNEDYDNIYLPVSKSIPLGLILNELITNSIKYSYRYGQKQDWVFDISIKNTNNSVKLIVKDNGPGFSNNFNQETDTVSLGIFLVKTLTEQIDGEVKFSNDMGAKIELNFILN